MPNERKQTSNRRLDDPNSDASRRTFLKGTGALAAAGTLGSFEAEAHGDYPNRVVGYYPAWAGDYGPEDVPFDRLTHLNFAFLEPESDGTVVLGDPSDDQLLDELAAYDDDEDTVFQLSISGGWYPQEFSDAAATQENRERFARTAVDKMETYGFDGLDIDWEFPDGTTRPEDPENFTLLLEAVRDELDERFGSWTHLTIAASPNSNVADDAYDVGTIESYLDHVNVMTYDYHGDWSDDTNVNAPLHSPPEDPDGQGLDVAASMNYWADQPIATEKLVMGLPFYGRSYSGVSSTDEGLFNAFDSATTVTFADVTENLKPRADYEYHWHHDAKAPWVYSAAENAFVAYDDEASIANKCRFVTDEGFGGVMAWELSQDPSNALVDRMHHEMHAGYANAAFDLREHVVTVGELWVRDGPGLSNAHVDTAPADTTGTVTDGPVDSDGYTWYEVSYDDGVTDGWSAANALASTKFDANHSTVTNGDVWVRDGPGLSNAHVDTAPQGTDGTVLDGPVESDGYTWWRVDYDGGVSTGWSAGAYLDRSY